MQMNDRTLEVKKHVTLFTTAKGNVTYISDSAKRKACKFLEDLQQSDIKNNISAVTPSVDDDNRSLRIYEDRFDSATNKLALDAGEWNLNVLSIR
jgi:hypothetical protein